MNMVYCMVDNLTTRFFFFSCTSSHFYLLYSRISFFLPSWVKFYDLFYLFIIILSWYHDMRIMLNGSTRVNSGCFYVFHLINFFNFIIQHWVSWKLSFIIYINLLFTRIYWSILLSSKTFFLSNYWPSLPWPVFSLPTCLSLGSCWSCG
jgi:hypothetical protein